MNLGKLKGPLISRWGGLRKRRISDKTQQRKKIAITQDKGKDTKRHPIGKNHQSKCLGDHPCQHRDLLGGQSKVITVLELQY